VIQPKAHEIIGLAVETRIFLADEGNDVAEIRILHES
jgi:hypothetical protein